jgi:hypothetical protein
MMVSVARSVSRTTASSSCEAPGMRRVADVVGLEPGDLVTRFLDVVGDVLELADDRAVQRAEEGLHGVGHLV